MATKLYIGNLSFKATEDDLQKLFSQYGSVQEVSIISDRQTGRPKGFAFVHMATEEEAQRALEMNEREFMGRNLQVSQARSEGPYPSGSGARRDDMRRNPGVGSERGAGRNW